MATKEESFYNVDKFGSRGRSIRLNELKQELPEGLLKVVDCKKRTALNDPSLTYPILVLEDEDGNQFDVMAWERDVIECGREWGAVNPKDWGYVTFRLNSAKTRYEIVPSKEQPIKTENVRSRK